MKCTSGVSARSHSWYCENKDIINKPFDSGRTKRTREQYRKANFISEKLDEFSKNSKLIQQASQFHVPMKLFDLIKCTRFKKRINDKKNYIPNACVGLLRRTFKK